MKCLHDSVYMILFSIYDIVMYLISYIYIAYKYVYAQYKYVHVHLFSEDPGGLEKHIQREPGFICPQFNRSWWTCVVISYRSCTILSRLMSFVYGQWKCRTYFLRNLPFFPFFG